MFGKVRGRLCRGDHEDEGHDDYEWEGELR